MFKKKQKNVVQEVDESVFKEDGSFEFGKTNVSEVSKFYLGARDLKDYIAPPAFDRGHESHIQVGEKYVRSFSLAGYPKEVYVGWLSDLYDSENDMDTQMFIEPTDDRTALDELTNKIAQYESQLMIEREKGSIRNITSLSAKVSELYQERALLEQNAQNIFRVSIAANLYTDDLKELKSQSQKLDHRLKGRKIYLQSNTLRQDEGYKTATPYGRNYILDTYRNLNTGAIVASFPFYNAELMHRSGIYMGRNLSTGSPVFIDPFNREALTNSNFTVFGVPGSGKTVFVSAFTLRAVLRGARATIIDPEGEYRRLVEDMGGANIVISPESDSFINIFEIEEEDEYDSDGYPTGGKIVLIKDKVSDLLNLIGLMLGHDLDGDVKSMLSFILAETYEERGITRDPASLYVEDAEFDQATGNFFYADVKKKMPVFSDFYAKLVEVAKKENNEKLTEVTVALKMYTRGGLYGMFDCETSDSLKYYTKAPVINFDISKIESDQLKPIAMYIALSFSWEKFGKKNKEQKKYIISDESWMLLKGKNRYAAEFLENLSRRARKRTCGLVVASQKFNEFVECSEGAAVLTNSAMNVFLKAKPEDCDGIQNMFKLSDGERNFILQAKRGEALIKTSTEAAIMHTHVLHHEKDIFFRNKRQEPEEGE